MLFWYDYLLHRYKIIITDALFHLCRKTSQTEGACFCYISSSTLVKHFHSPDIKGENSGETMATLPIKTRTTSSASRTSKQTEECYGPVPLVHGWPTIPFVIPHILAVCKNHWLLITFTLQSSRVILVPFQDHQHWDMGCTHFHMHTTNHTLDALLALYK